MRPRRPGRLSSGPGRAACSQAAWLRVPGGPGPGANSERVRSPAARAEQPALGRQLQSRWLGPPPPSPGPRPAAERGVARFVCAQRGGGGPGAPGAGGGANAGGEGGGGAGSDCPAPRWPHPPASAAPIGWLGWVHTVKSQDFAKRTGLGVVSHCGEPRGAPNFPDLPLVCRGEHASHPQFQDGKGSCCEVSAADSRSPGKRCGSPRRRTFVLVNGIFV